MPTTPVYALPYQALTDSPHGPNLGQDLAEAVETEIVRVDAALVRMDTVTVVRVYTAGDTWSKPAGLKEVDVEVQAGGGGNGGNASTAGSQGAASGGGGGGGYSRKRIPAGTLGATETVTVGAAGSAAAAGANTGGTGGTSSFGAHCSATGGVGGSGGTAGATGFAAGGAGGTGSSGDINVTGGPGGHGIVVATGVVLRVAQGGRSQLGPETAVSTTGAGSDGVAGTVYGGGASGAVSNASTAARAGVVGSAGVVIVREYY